MRGVVNVISKTPRQLDGTSVTLGYGAVNRDVAGGVITAVDTLHGVELEGLVVRPKSTQPFGSSYRVSITHADTVNNRWAYKFSAGFNAMDALARPVGTVPTDLDRGTGGGAYPDEESDPPFVNSGTTQPKLDVRVDYDYPDGRQKLIVAGGVAGTSGIMHTGIGPFDIQSGTVLGYGKVNYERDNWKVNFFANILDGDAPALLAIGPTGQPINFLFDNKTYDVEVGNSNVLGTRHIVTYGGNFRYNSFDLSIAPLGNNRTEGGFYIQDEIFLSEHFRWLVGGRADGFSVIDKFVFSPRTTFMVKPTQSQTFRVSFNRAFRAPSFVNSFLDVTFLQQIDLGELAPRLPGPGGQHPGAPILTYTFPVVATGNIDLNEESLTAYEIGYTGTFANRYTLSAAWYLNKTKNNIFFTQSENYSSANPPPRWPLSPGTLDFLTSIGRGLPSNFTYLNFNAVTDTGIELGLNAQLNSDVSVFGNYSWQDEPDPETPEEFSELNIPPANRFNVGLNYSGDRFFGSLSVNYTDTAFWTDVLDARFHGATESYTMLNGGLGVRFAEGKVSAGVKFSNWLNENAQQHIFGDIIKRHVLGELKFNFN